MCGIAGALVPAGDSSGADLGVAVTHMTDALAHRGPDGHGIARVADATTGDGCDVVFGHTRLAIIDLSERGAQPMANADATLAVTFNGEIYNHREVRERLRREGTRFRSDSDTEVLLHGYDRWGEDVVDRLDGMFAFALWDRRRQVLRLVRDRLGIKPLYFSHQGRGVLFASEVRALLASARVPRRLDASTVDAFLRYQTVPSPRTLVAGVEMAPPGTIVTIDARGARTTRQYWDLMAPARAGAGAATTITDARAGVHARLVESARQHLVSDVPVGLFLSGGIDSSALVALVGATGITPRTFTVAFPGTPYDEAPFARAVAGAFETAHTEIALSEADAARHVQTAVETVNHPSGDGINAYIVAAAVRSAGIKVALSGIGGDEFFGGYPSFRRLPRLERYGRVWRHAPPGLRRAAARTLRRIGPDSVAGAKAAALVEGDGSLARAYPVMREVFSRAQRASLVTPAAAHAALADGDAYETLLAAAMPGLAGVLARVSYAEARTYMHDVLLRDTNQMSMRHGLEVRVPLLNHHLVEYLMALPDALKAPGAAPKRLLIESLGAPLPAVCTNRPKRGFVLPFDDWMRTRLKPFCAHHLGPDGLGRRGPFQAEAVDGIWRAFLDRSASATWARPWTLVALSAWMESTGVDL